ncbi:MAG: capsule biosynthesis protein CapF [Rhodocyclaceae bacterium]|nr:SDR family oxidoreductase [Zoogloeaceae bacterium]MCG3168409.1 UDP-2-acetamido-2,6-beta-L-arabino-hexul-4-ose reductase [Bacteroidia bacterium]MCQ3922734.1 capsule biosynthesis protein CapF [Rhodocyclaceae bacterium]HNQ57287.1 NAD-dependent epimerase/dehydratase family protein [Candidatus Desulfobacillus denitrificans]HNT61849.1 NAD-dependent epimerase/dehydratase family protein [Candidatus Desulfobacillus denitrificans]
MSIGITGADGLLGFHLRARLHAQGWREVRLATRQTFASPAALDEFAEGLGGIVHLAGMNRGDEAEVEETNVRLAADLVAALERTGSRPALVFANSIHVERDSGYGRGKRAAAALLREWAASSGSTLADLVLPHVFGEFGKPSYNSVVSTFCYQLATGECPEVHVDGRLELLHAQDVAQRCLEMLRDREVGTIRMMGAPMAVSELLVRLRDQYERYADQVVPDLRDRLDLQLFNTLRSYLYPRHYPVSLELRRDARGGLFEAVKTLQGGQVFFSNTHPGVTRGNHYHLRKVERFLVVGGEAEIRLRKLFSPQVESFRVTGASPCYIDMPTFHTHSISNAGSGDLTTLFWSNEIFDPADPDTYAENVTT